MFGKQSKDGNARFYLLFGFIGKRRVKKVFVNYLSGQCAFGKKCICNNLEFRLQLNHIIDELEVRLKLIASD